MSKFIRVEVHVDLEVADDADLEGIGFELERGGQGALQHFPSGEVVGFIVTDMPKELTAEEVEHEGYEE